MKMHRSDVVEIQIDTFMLIWFSLYHLKKFEAEKKIVKTFLLGASQYFHEGGLILGKMCHITGSVRHHYLEYAAEKEIK